MAKKPFSLKKGIEVAEELADLKNKQILKTADAFEENQHRKDRKKVPPVARNDLGLGKK